MQLMLKRSRVRAGRNTGVVFFAFKHDAVEVTGQQHADARYLLRKCMRSNMQGALCNIGSSHTGTNGSGRVEAPRSQIDSTGTNSMSIGKAITRMFKILLLAGLSETVDGQQTLAGRLNCFSCRPACNCKPNWHEHPYLKTLSKPPAALLGVNCMLIVPTCQKSVVVPIRE